ncbi:MAG: hypothetical protein ACRD5E_14325 [Nitrososphaeraceae archaeon]
MDPNKIAKELEDRYKKRMDKKRRGGRRQRFTRQHFTPREEDFNFKKVIIEKWVKEKRGAHSHDSAVLSHSFQVGGIIDCNGLTDEWWRWALRTPINSSPSYGLTQEGIISPHLFRKDHDGKTAKVYMIAVSAFKSSPPDVKKIVVTDRIPILFPIYNVSATVEEHLWDSKRTPKQNTASLLGDQSAKLTEIVLDDLCGIYSFDVNYDHIPIEGCTVLRQHEYKIESIPRENMVGVPAERLGNMNSIRVCHGGLYLLLNNNSDAMSAGEHLLSIKVLSVNYEVETKIHLNVQTR